MIYKSSKRGTAIVSYHDFANEAWLYMENHQLSQVDVMDGEARIGTLNKSDLDGIDQEARLRMDVRDLFN